MTKRLGGRRAATGGGGRGSAGRFWGEDKLGELGDQIQAGGWWRKRSSQRNCGAVGGSPQTLT